MVVNGTADKNKENMGQKTGMEILVVEFPVHGNKIVHREDGCHAAGGNAKEKAVEET